MREACLRPKAGLQARKNGWKMDDLIIQTADIMQSRYALLGIKVLCCVGQKQHDSEVEDKLPSCW